MAMIIFVIAVSIGLIVASFTDINRFKVYNALTFPLFFAGLAFGAITAGWSGLGFAFGGAGTGLAILLIPYLMGGLGAGDVKFVMAIGTWLGGWLALISILVGCAVLLIYYMAIIARRERWSGLMANLNLMALRLRYFGNNLVLGDRFETVQAAAGDPQSSSRGRLIPFSAMMSVGVCIVLLLGWRVGYFQI